MRHKQIPCVLAWVQAAVPRYIHRANVSLCPQQLDHVVDGQLPPHGDGRGDALYQVVVPVRNCNVLRAFTDASRVLVSMLPV